MRDTTSINYCAHQGAHRMADVGQTAVTVPIIPWEEITLGKELGRGGFGIVYRGDWRHGGDVAVKQIQGILGADAAKELQEEASVMARLSSPYIVRLFGLCWEHQKYAMVMELMPRASLYDLLHNGQPLPWSVRYAIAQDIAFGLRLLHERRILHRDLKSLNVLLDDRLRARLSDFGLAKVKAQSGSTSKAPGSSVGTTAWMAPELFSLSPKYSKGSDLYAYGMTAWEIAARELPYSAVRDPSVIENAIKRGERAETPEDCPPTFATIIQSCWAQDVAARPGIDKVVAMLGEIIKANTQQPAKDDKPAAPTTPAYQDGSLDSLGLVTKPTPEARPAQDDALQREMAQLRLDKQKAVQEKQALEQKLAQQQKTEQERLAKEKAEQEKARLEQERKKAQEREAQQRAEAAARPAPPPPRPMLPQAQAAASKPRPAFPPEAEHKYQAAAPQIAPAEVSAFLKQVAAGLQDEAEASLRRNASLALATGDVTDHANRTFRNITGFQYALWALDWHMWKMILKYLPADAASAQAQTIETGSWVKQHGIVANWDILLKELQTYIDNYDPWTAAQSQEHWTKKVGGAQRLLPIHVLQEYCHPIRRFEPTPSFKEEEFPRKLDVDISKLGSEFGLCRGCDAAGAWAVTRAVPARPGGARARSPADRKSLTSLANIRSEQRKELLATLSRRDRMGGPRT